MIVTFQSTVPDLKGCQFNSNISKVSSHFLLIRKVLFAINFLQELFFFQNREMDTCKG